MALSPEGIPLEIERRFLVRMPSENVLRRISSGSYEIEQYYLPSDGDGGIRLRRIRQNGSDRYVETVKHRVSDAVRTEEEREIPAEAYFEGIRTPGSSSIRKVRYLVPNEGKTFELDLFPFWEDRAILEIELASETETFHFPKELTVLREITCDRRYTNRALALSVPSEAL